MSGNDDFESKTRRERGFIWGADQLDFGNKVHYLSALRCRDITDEEYWHQSVFHGPDHAINLVKEVFQKKVRNQVTSQIDQETVFVSNMDDSPESTSYIIREPDNPSIESTDPTRYLNIIEVVVSVYYLCSIEAFHVLVYMTYKVNIDSIILEQVTDKDVRESYDAVIQVLHTEVINTQTPYKLLGNRTRYDKARNELRRYLEEGFSDLLRSL